MLEIAQRIREELDEIKDPCSLAAGQPMGLSEMGLVRDVEISADGDVAIAMRLTSPFCHMIGFFKSETIKRIGALPGVRSVTMTADQGLDWSPNDISPSAAARRSEVLARMTA
jgi:metal-sulfur cluster biosynthetic enzyme